MSTDTGAGMVRRRVVALCQKRSVPTEGWKALESRGQQKTYLGKKLGDLSAGKHGVFGTLYAGSGKALILEDFSYDGTAPGRHMNVAQTRLYTLLPQKCL